MSQFDDIVVAVHGIGAQSRNAAGARGAFGRIIERLKARLEHRGNLLSAFRWGNYRRLVFER